MFDYPLARLEGLGCKPVRAFKPFWDRKGKTFEDSNGYRIVLQNSELVGRTSRCTAAYGRGGMFIGRKPSARHSVSRSPTLGTRAKLPNV